MIEQRTLWEEEPQKKKTKASPKENWERPLADRMRPRTLDEFVGQEHLIGAGRPLRRLLEAGEVPSAILYGPPGSGKTTLVRLMASVTGRKLLEINAVTAKVSQLRELVDAAKEEKEIRGGKTPLAFVDEIYHFNKQQQNVLLPAVERGDLILLGTTVENPYFEINKTLLSRAIVLELRPLKAQELVELLRRALTDVERGLGKLGIEAESEAIARIAELSSGDARQALNRLEALAMAASKNGRKITAADVEALSPKALQRYDRAADEHYAVISAFIKSVRGSDPDAAVYWLARMLASGEDVRFIARRLLILAAEDVGLADPLAIAVAASAAYAVDWVGLPEGRIILSEATIYLASAPKSNSAYKAIDAAMSAVEGGDLMEVPPHLHATSPDYKYPHDDPRHWLPQNYLPEPRHFYHPGSLGKEAEMRDRLRQFWRRYRDDVSGQEKT